MNDKEMLEQQKLLVKWTRRYFWATVVMAVAAGLAAYFTARYVGHTGKLLEQAHKTNEIAVESLDKARRDSRLEFRPYVLDRVFQATIEQMVEKGDSTIYTIKINAVSSNPGRTPAYDYRSISFPSITEITDSLIEEQQIKAALELKFRASLLGNIESGFFRIFQIQVPKDVQKGSGGTLVDRGETLSFIVDNPRDFPIYYNIVRCYSDYLRENLYNWLYNELPYAGLSRQIAESY